MTRFWAVAAAVVAVAGIAGTAGYVWLGRDRLDQALAACRQGQAGAPIGGPFTLTDSHGVSVTDKDVLKGPTLVYFGYTFCPDVCPLDMSRNAEVVDMLAEQGKKLGLVFISIDPKRDTPEVVGEFAANFGPDTIGLTGTPEQVKAASLAYKTYYNANDDGTDYYTVDHSTFTYLMLPEIGFADFYRHDTPAEEVAKGVSCMLDAVAAAN